MAHIDRTQKEKVIRIGKWQIKYASLCVLGLLLILTFSSLAYLESYLNVRANQPKDTETEQKIQVALVVTFDENTSTTKVVDIEPNVNARFAFNKIANITTEDTPSGKRPVEVQAKNDSLAKNQTHSWLFFVNGGLNFKGLDQYIVKNGDTLELQFSKNIG